MSRSRKKPYLKDGYKSKWKPKAKRNATKALKDVDISSRSPGAYKKHYCSWNICDFNFYSNEPKYRRK